MRPIGWSTSGPSRLERATANAATTTLWLGLEAADVERGVANAGAVALAALVIGTAFNHQMSRGPPAGD